MAYSAIAVANAFIEKAKSRGIKDLTPMKLQKLVFYAHAWSLVMNDSPLVKDKIYAWPYGPVIESVYHEFKGYGSTNITTPGTEFVWDDNPNAIVQAKYVAPKIPPSDSMTMSVIDAILDAYGDESAISLSNLTHRPGSAWAATQDTHGGGTVRNFVIPDQIIKECTARELGLGD
ncbi:Panacea domain-containing protein [Serratia oryzae]|uniref:Panacea domain-containing protein n=1 Tax=Serratia oryzae TaxID=2034155 RepID=UPI0012E1E378|nr:type II toxin-antitoxin system antitoxin SocA domain-containing protein [Serratia oryzae]